MLHESTQAVFHAVELKTINHKFEVKLESVRGEFERRSSRPFVSL